jgi:hypothetical protein
MPFARSPTRLPSIVKVAPHASMFAVYWASRFEQWVSGCGSAVTYWAQIGGMGNLRLASDRRRGRLGGRVQIAGELISGAVALLAQDNVYGAAALLRQLVEGEYLAWAFAEDEQEAMSWMRSDRDERMRMWQPKHLRNRSQDRFRATDYHSHCERGGHPTPDATMLLPGHSRRQLPELWWLDLAEHGVSTWRYANDAALRLGYEDWMRSGSEENGLPTVIERWEQCDRLRSVARQMQTLLIPGR